MRPESHLEQLAAADKLAQLLSRSAEDVNRELGQIASAAEDPATHTIIGRVFAASDRILAKPPRDSFGINSAFRPLQELAAKLDPTPVDQSPSMLDQLIEAGSRDVETAQVFLQAFSQTLGVFGVSPSRDVHDLDSDSLRVKSPRGFGFNSTTVKGANNVHVEVKPDTQVYTVSAPELETPPAQLTENGTSVEVEVPTNNPDDGRLGYEVALAIQDGNKWRLVQMQAPLSFQEFDPEVNLHSQMLGYWTSDLPTQIAPYAILVRTGLWNSKQAKEIAGSNKVRVDFAEAEGEQTMIQKLIEFGYKPTRMFSETYNVKGGVELSAQTAAQLIHELIEQGKTDLLNLPITAKLEWREKIAALKLSFCARVGTQTNPGETIPLGILVHKDGTTQELIYSGESWDDLSDGDKQILEETGFSGDGPAQFLVFDYATAHKETGKSENSTDSNSTSRKLFIEPLTREESRAEGSEWQGNLLSVVPTVTLREHDESVSKPIEELKTVRDLLFFYATKDDFSPIIWNAPKVAALCREEQEALRLLQQSRSLGSSLSFGGDLLGGGQLRSLGVGGLRRFSGASTRFGEEEDTGSARIGTVEATGQFAPVNFRLITIN